MTDKVSKEKRSEIMSSVRHYNTTPEIRVRKILHELGYRFRIHRKDLPGTPDIVLPKYKIVIFVHGCYWHHHDCKKGRKLPQTNVDFWTAKFDRNVRRDEKNVETLKSLGWKVVVIWECEITTAEKLKKVVLERLAAGNDESATAIGSRGDSNAYSGRTD